MNPLDIIIVVILSFCLIRGLFRGLVKEISSIVGVLGGLYFAGTFHQFVADFLEKWLPSLPMPDLLSYFVLFTAVFVAISLLGILIRFLLKVALLGWADRILGGVFGGVKAICLIGVILIGLVTFLPENTAIISKSHLTPYVVLAADAMIHMVPDSMKDKFEKKIDKMEKKWKKKTGWAMVEKCLPPPFSPNETYG